MQNRSTRVRRCQLHGFEWLSANQNQLLLVSALLLTQAGLLGYSATQHSPTKLEPAFLASGISHWQLGTYELYRVNPPLVRMVAALPVLAAGCQSDWSRNQESPGSRAEFLVGQDFVRVNGVHSIPLFIYARWACVPFSLVGSLFAYCWARELYGPVAGLLTLILYVFEPNLLAHGELITPDSACVAFGIFAGYTYWRWLKQPNWSCALIAGGALGLAELSKMSWLILFGLWPLLWAGYRLAIYCEGRGIGAAQPTAIPGFRQHVLILFCALSVVNIGYAFDGFGKPLKDFPFVSSSLTGLKTAGVVGNRFRGTWLGAIPVPLPEQYVLGFDSQKKDFEFYPQRSFLRGELQQGGWWYYYLYGLLVKVPCGTWGLLAFVILSRFLSNKRPVLLRDEMMLLVPAVSLLAFVSLQTEFTIHLRYVFPSLGLALIFLGQAVRGLHPKFPLTAVLPCALAAYSVVSTLSIYPNQLAYFNEFVGGPSNGFRHLVSSNLAWGQSLLRLKKRFPDQGESSKIHLAVESDYDPAWLGVNCDSIPSQPEGVSDVEWIDALAPGIYVIDVNMLWGANIPWGVQVPLGESYRGFDGYRCFRGLRPEATIDYGLLIYRISKTHQQPDYQKVVIGSNSIRTVRIKPISLKPKITGLETVSPEDVARLLRRVKPLADGMTASLCLHVISAHGLGKTLDNDTFHSTTSLCEMLFDSNKSIAFFGSPVLTKTRYGVRPSMNPEHGPAKEGHDNQMIACAAQLGLPLTHEISVSGERHSLRDVLADSIASFDLEQREPEWAAIAYSAYLPPYSRWVNKFGDRMSFDRIADELLGRDLEPMSCCGCHTVEAMIALHRVDQEYSPILSPEMRDRLEDRIRALVQTALDEQLADGSWNPKWFQRTEGSPSLYLQPIWLRMLATSHILHWLSQVAEQESIEAQVYDRAMLWLRQHLLVADDDFIRLHFCPYSHGVWVLRDLCGDPGG